MTRLTFRISASSLTSNIAVKQNVIDYSQAYPKAAQTIQESLYVDDGLTGGESIGKVMELQIQPQKLFAFGGFMLCKWKLSEPTVLTHIPPDLLDQQSYQEIVDNSTFAKVIGMEWNSDFNSF